MQSVCVCVRTVWCHSACRLTLLGGEHLVRSLSSEAPVVGSAVGSKSASLGSPGDVCPSRRKPQTSCQHGGGTTTWAPLYKVFERPSDPKLGPKIEAEHRTAGTGNSSAAAAVQTSAVQEGTLRTSTRTQFPDRLIDSHWLRFESRSIAKQQIKDIAFMQIISMLADFQALAAGLGVWLA